MSISKQKLSGSANGRGIKVAQTATPGTLIHTAVDVANNLDEVWLWAANSDAAERKLTLELGGVTTPDDLLEFTAPPEDGAYLLVPGWVYDGGVIIRAFCEAANVVMLHGYVHRVNQS